MSTVQYATVAGGTAVPGVDYTPTSGTIIFQPGQLTATFTVGIINTHRPGGVKTVNLALANPTGGVLDFNTTAVLQITHLTGGLSGLFTVINTNDSGPARSARPLSPPTPLRAPMTSTSRFRQQLTRH